MPRLAGKSSISHFSQQGRSEKEIAEIVEEGMSHLTSLPSLFRTAHVQYQSDIDHVKMVVGKSVNELKFHSALQ